MNANVQRILVQNHLVMEHKMTTSSPTCHMTTAGLKEYIVVTMHYPPRGVSTLSWSGGLSMLMTLRSIPAVA